MLISFIIVSTVADAETTDLMTTEKRAKKSQQLSQLEFAGYEHFFGAGRISEQPSISSIPADIPNTDDAKISSSKSDPTWLHNAKKKSLQKKLALSKQSKSSRKAKLAPKKRATEQESAKPASTHALDDGR